MDRKTQAVIAKCVVRISASRKLGKTAYATGFFVNFVNRAGRSCLALITNRHVLIDKSQGHIAVCESIKFEYSYILNEKRYRDCWSVKDIEKRAVCHPNDLADLVAVNVDDLVKSLPPGAKFYHRILSNEDFDLASLDAVLSVPARVLMVGFPKGFRDQRHDMPIVRVGALAIDFDYGKTLDEDGTDCFYADIECVPGSSGSPIFLDCEGRIVLLGINRAGKSEQVCTWKNGDGGNRLWSICGHRSIHLSVCTKSSELHTLELQMERSDRNPIIPTEIGPEKLINALRRTTE